MTSETKEMSVHELIAELEALDAVIEQKHPGCQRRSDLWNQEGSFYHGMPGERRCPASDEHHRRRRLSGVFNELLAAGALSPVGSEQG